MKKIYLKLFVLSILVLLSGCGGSMYNYDVKPTPIKKGKAKYFVKNISLNLKHGHGRNFENKTFATEEELKKVFTKFISLELEKQSLIGTKEDFLVDVFIDYTRTYNYGGNALNKPEFRYRLKVFNNKNQKIASFSIPLSTTKYSYFTDIAVNAKIALFQWKADDEPRDLALISKTLVKDLSELGE